MFRIGIGVNLRAIEFQLANATLTIHRRGFDLIAGDRLDVLVDWLGDGTHGRTFFDYLPGTDERHLDVKVWAGRSMAILSWARKVPLTEAAKVA